MFHQTVKKGKRLLPARNIDPMDDDKEKLTLILEIGKRKEKKSLLTYFLANATDYINTLDEYLPIACTQLTPLPQMKRLARQPTNLSRFKLHNYIIQR